MQIHLDTCRSMQINNVSYNANRPKLQSLIRDFETAISYTKPQSPMTGAVVLAPLGAFGSATHFGPACWPQLKELLINSLKRDLNNPSSFSYPAHHLSSRPLKNKPPGIE